MRYFSTVLFLSLILTFGCQSPAPVTTSVNKNTEKQDKTTSNHPDWYSPGSHFTVDNTMFFGYAQSSNGDSLRSHQMAQKQAKANLETGISAYLENKRKDFLESNPTNRSVEENEFKFTLRNISEKISREAKVAEAYVTNNNNRHIGYCKTQISVQKVDEILKKLFASQSKYQAIVENWK